MLDNSNKICYHTNANNLLKRRLQAGSPTPLSLSTEARTDTLFMQLCISSTMKLKRDRKKNPLACSLTPILQLDQFNQFHQLNQLDQFHQSSVAVE